MDILSHGLWAAAGAKVMKETSPFRSRDISVRWAFFWGLFPDLFAFTIPFIWMMWNIVRGIMLVSDWPIPDRIEPIGHDGWPALQLGATLYQYSHSIIIAGIVSVVVLFYCYRRGKHVPLEMLGWPLHILMDVPTHSYRFFPTPVFWPISQWKFDGFSWAHPWFLAVNYGALVIVLLFLRLYGKKANHP